MAIKVGGTSVISDSRVLENVTGLKTVNSTSILGSGNISAGASTTTGGVATYGFFRDTSGVTRNPGATRAGSGLRWAGVGGTEDVDDGSNPSGTWKLMGRSRDNAENSVWIRIS